MTYGARQGPNLTRDGSQVVTEPEEAFLSADTCSDEDLQAVAPGIVRGDREMRSLRTGRARKALATPG